MQAATQKIVNRPSATMSPAPVHVRSTPGVAQASSLKISSPADTAEREAEQTAKRIMRMPLAQGGGTVTATCSPHAARFAGTLRQREPMRIARKQEGPPTTSPGVASKISASQSSGQPLPPSIRRLMEPRFNANFSGVRIHTGEQAARLNRQVSAQAFTVGNQIYFGRGRFQPESSEGRELIAHELTHTIQQGAVSQSTVQRSADVTVNERSSPQVQRLGLSNILDGLAELAANVPGFTLLTVIIGRNPINMRAVERNFTNLLRGFMGLIPGGEILFQVLDRYGVVGRLGNWVNQQVSAMGLSFDYIRGRFTAFTDSLGWRDIFSPGDVWRRAQNIFTEPVTRIRNFVSSLTSQAIAWLKETFMQPLSNFCRQVPGYGLVTVMLGRDPFTNTPVPGTALNVVRGVAEFIPEGTEKVNQLVESRGLQRAYDWFIQETRSRNLTWARVTGTFAQAWNSLQLSDVLHPIDTLQRIGSLFAPLLNDLAGFARSALMKLLEFIFEAVMGAGGARILAILKRAQSTFMIIIRNPVAFLGNLLRGVGQGVRQFMQNILQHLQTGVIAWLTGPVARAGIQIPERWDLHGVISFVLQILGLTWARVREKLVRLMGERAVAMLETGFQLIQDIREKGFVQALRDRITEFFGQLQERALGAIRSFIQQRIVMAGITQLLSMLSPVGAVIQAIIKTYTTIQFFIQRINQILDLVESVVNSIAAIAAGSVGAAASFIERTMARTIPVILDFLARFIGLGDIGGLVQQTIRGLQVAVDQMLDRAVDWIKNMAQRLASRALGGDPNASPQQRVEAGVREGIAAVNRLSGERVGIALIRPVLAVIRLRHNMRSLDAEARGDTWYVVGVVNPNHAQPSSKKPSSQNGNLPDGSSEVRAIPIRWVKGNVSGYPRLDVITPSVVINARTNGTPIPTNAPRTLLGPRTETILLNAEKIGVTDPLSADLRIGKKFIARVPQSSNNVKDAMNRTLRNDFDYDRTRGAGAPTANDHVLEKQLGGLDDRTNLWPLNETINSRSGGLVRGDISKARSALGISTPGLQGKWVILVDENTPSPYP